MLRVQHAQQFVLVDNQNLRRRHCGRRAHPHRLARHASLAEEIIRTKHRNDSFLSRSVNDRKFHAALLHVHYALGWLTLRVDRFASRIFAYFSRNSTRIKKYLWIEGIDLL